MTWVDIQDDYSRRGVFAQRAASKTRAGLT